MHLYTQNNFHFLIGNSQSNRVFCGGQNNNLYAQNYNSTNRSLWDYYFEPSFTFDDVSGSRNIGNDIGEFTMPDKKSTDTGYNCGVMPPIDISNKELLQTINTGDIFTASDFEVTILEITSTSPSPSGRAGEGLSGTGYIQVPYLADTKIKVVFDNIKINTDYKMIEGVVKTTFDPTMGNIVDVKKGIEDIKKQAEMLGGLLTALKDAILNLDEIAQLKKDCNSGKLSEDDCFKKQAELTQKAQKQYEG